MTYTILIGSSLFVLPETDSHSDILHPHPPSTLPQDGSDANNTLDKDGLPSPIKVHAVDSAERTLAHANCLQCVQVRLMLCSDGACGKTAYPACGSEAQAKCATSSGTKCQNKEDYLETLKGVTTANLVNGTAIFTDLQVQHVVGAGYKLKFTFNAKYTPTSCPVGSGGEYPTDYASGSHVASACRHRNSFWDVKNDCCDKNGGRCAPGYKSFLISNAEETSPDPRGSGCTWHNNARRTCCLEETVGTTPLLEFTSDHDARGHVSIPDDSYSTSTNRYTVLFNAISEQA